MIPGITLASIFLFLSLLHWYWVVSGNRDFASVVPEVDGRPAFQPGALATSAVAVLLLAASLVCAAEAGLPELSRSTVTRSGVWVLLVVFFLRAMGEFHLVGFFKRVRGTRFARLDSWIYSPLCLVISALCAALLLSSRQCS